MAKPVQADLSHYMRKETALLIALLALAVGFFGGVFFGVYQIRAECGGDAGRNAGRPERAAGTGRDP